MRPHLGHVEDIPLVGLGLLGVHHLHVDVPHGVVAPFDVRIKIVDQVVRVLTRQLLGGLAVEILDTDLRLDVDLDIFERAIL